MSPANQNIISPRNYFFLYAIIILFLGVLGGITHPPSLIAGGVSGAILLIAAILLPKHRRGSLIAILIVSILLMGRAVPVFFKTLLFYPNGIMAAVSFIGAVLAIQLLFRKA